MILLSNFTNNKISEKLLNDFAVVAIEMMKGGEERGLEVQMNLMPPRKPKLTVFSIFWIFRAASRGRHDSLPNSVFFNLI
jgi:hypothetical protein